MLGRVTLGCRQAGKVVVRRVSGHVSQKCPQTIVRSLTSSFCNAGNVDSSCCTPWPRRAISGSTLHGGQHGLKEKPQEDNALSAVVIVQTVLDPDRKRLDIVWNDGDVTSYPYVWLRDCCQCPDCFHHGTASRRLLFHQLNLNVMPINVEIISSAQEVVVTWPDEPHEHRSVYRYSWLLARSFRYKEQSARARWNGRQGVQWGREVASQLPQTDFNKLLTDDKELYNWLTALEEYGFVVVTGSPHQPGQLQRIAERVAFLRQTNIGLTSFEHPHREATVDQSYTISAQELHNDHTSYYNVPGMKMVHCISQPLHGDVEVVLFADGFQAAKQLRDRYPEQFRLLSSVKLDFSSVTPNSILLSRHPTIKLDDAGDVVQINYSTRHRDSFIRLGTDDVEPLYKALRIFTDILYEPKNLVEIKLQNDVIYCFNNWRVLHGRKAFQVVPGTEPCIERGYIDWDELHSKRRVLKSKLDIPDEQY